MKKLLLLVSFGTSDKKVIESCIDPMKRDIEENFKEFSVLKVFTSRNIREKLILNYNYKVFSLEEAMKIAYKDAVEEVIILPLYLMEGNEQGKLELEVSKYKNNFKIVKIIPPLLALNSIGKLKECEDLIKAILQLKPKDKGLLFIGHGMKNNINLPFILLQKEFESRGFKGIYFTTLEGSPSYNEVIEEIKKDNVTYIKVTSFLMVSGYHSQKDIFGENSESCCSILERKGFKVEKDILSLGERISFRELYLKRIIKVLD